MENFPEEFMLCALKEAKKACNMDEVPVGCVIVREGKIIAKAHNLREAKKNPCAHAEILAILKAAKKLHGWRLSDAELYVTLEPCPMCAGAIINARINKVYFGAYDKKAGAFGSLLNLNSYGLNHKPDILGGILEEQCSSLLKEYFLAKRTARND